MRLSIENWLENQPVGIVQYYLIPKENKKFAIYSDFESTAALLYFLEEFLLLYAKCVGDWWNLITHYWNMFRLWECKKKMSGRIREMISFLIKV